MLHEFLTSNREEILKRTRLKVAARIAPHPTREELETGIPLFVDQLITSLRVRPYANAGINAGATLHGEQRQHMGFTVGQLVHDYGDVCQSVTQLAIELNAPISTEDFKGLNRSLDDAIAQAVTEHARVQELSTADEQTQRFAFFAHELRNLLNTASLAYDVLLDGTVAVGGSTGALLGRSLSGLRNLVDRTLAEVRLDVGISHQERLDVCTFLKDVELAGMIAAKQRGVSFFTTRGAPGVAVDVDRQLLNSALANLLQNAFKFTRLGGKVWLRTKATAERVLIEVEDECGGLPPEMIDQLFLGFQQHNPDKTGLGIGLAISKRAVEAIGGELRAHNNAQRGCVFTVDLPRVPSSATSAA